MSEATAIERLLRRDRSITVVALAVLCVLASLYIISGAGLGMNPSHMTSWSLFPHSAAPMPDMAMPDMPDMPGMESAQPPPAVWSPGLWLLMIAMWWTMMIAMMTPAAAPAILLYARVHRHAGANAADSSIAPTGAFASGYLAVWLAFSIVATILTWLLGQTDLFNAATMGSQSRWLSGVVLIAAGFYQLSPLKNVCLSHCRAPAEFLTRHRKPGAAGAFRIGVIHGAYCVGCCWLLMALLFVGGVMNLIWIALLAVLVLLEKNAPFGNWVARVSGLALIAWGIATFVV
ncbi:MAG: DUF2182 domain-containing protein [Hyphomonadaceae bacterium]